MVSFSVFPRRSAWLAGAVLAALSFGPASIQAQGNVGDPAAGKRPAVMVTPPAGPVNSATYTAPPEPKYDYVDALHKSFLFYWAQRSGKLPYQRLAWRGDSFIGLKGPHGEDISGGWFEAANTMKWGGPFAFTAMQLAWNVYEFGDAMKQTNELNEALAWVRVGAEQLVGLYTTDGTTERLIGLIGDSARVENGKIVDVDFGYFGPPEEYQQWVPGGQPPGVYYCEGSPTVNKGCSGIAGDYAAALALSSLVLRPYDAPFADRCLAAARSIYSFGTKYVGTYSDATKFPEQAWKNYQDWYGAATADDELALAATWLYTATKEKAYLDAATASAAKIDAFSEYSWGDKGIAVYILLNRIAPSAALQTQITTTFRSYLPGGSVKRTPRGLVWNEPKANTVIWGSLSYAANLGFLGLVHAKGSPGAPTDPTFATQLRTFAVQQINYILGDTGRSWLVGFGTNFPKSPYHKSSYNSFIDYPMRGQPQGNVGSDFLSATAPPNRFILYGALEGGPWETDEYVDNRADYTFTEVTQDYNAAFTGALAGLIDFYGPSKFKNASDCNLDLGWSHPNASAATRQPKYTKGDCYHTCDPCMVELSTPGLGAVVTNGVPSTTSINPGSTPPTTGTAGGDPSQPADQPAKGNSTESAAAGSFFRTPAAIITAILVLGGVALVLG
ncbi:Six-hairpin glycosidase-like protein [Fimicolochytrium jonesii]|uniref:Six-hairpin glycosidase-like protein n=1 Tax=Fimicolochytrium jonesii TaxID=1396493 RepID=UPI0022FE4408|nr:Six-hairpin glycosidase-like protein [Fimicolochytrium jonesii]KAI8822167.1 Six-hairpin glycosidase-like protein [Fimicolochytrium jonesii]